MHTDQESSEQPWPYPSNDRSLELASGRVVRFYDLIIVTGLGEPSFDVHYRSELKANDDKAREAEAAELISYFADTSPSCKNIKRANASVCSTPEQAATRELPEEIFLFERRDGEWRYKGKAPLPPRTA